MTYDLAVIGLGAVGGAAALAGARAGRKVVGFDAFAPPHDRGSTHGETRIVRQAIGEGLAYVPLALRSFALWDQLAAETRTDLVTRCGFLLLGDGLPHATHVPHGFLQTTIAAARAHAIPHEVMTAEEVRRRFPAFAAFDGPHAYLEPGAGMASPERVVAAQIARARDLGADLRMNAPVIQVAQDGPGVVVRTRTEVVRAARAVLAAGAWTPRFLPPGLAARLKVTRQVLHWFDAPPGSSVYEPSRMPAFVWGDLYGFPETRAGAGVKIATEALDDLIDPDKPREVSAAEVARMSARVAPVFPSLGAHRRSATCLYTATPDFNFWAGPHPEIENLTVISACSGHGFKHAAALGEAVVHAAQMNSQGEHLASWRIPQNARESSKTEQN